jgi:nucleoside-diphosphate-sugar epimerase
MKYIVTGGAGFIGSHIVEELAQQQHEVVILDNLFSGKMENIQPFLKNKNVTFVQESITDLSVLKKSFEGADGIFHEGAIASVPRSIASPLATNEANVTGTLNVLVAARDCGVRKVLFASSSSVYGNTPTLPKQEDMTPNPLSPYAVSKLTGEHYLKVFSEIYGFKTVSLRYFNVFGPRQDPKSEYAAVIPRFITKILRHESPTIYGDGGQTRDFTYVKDVVQANIRAMESEAQGVFNVAYCKRIDLNELASLIMEITGISVPLVYEPPRTGDVRDSLADIRRAQEAFGYAPEYTVKTGLKETIVWYQK